MLDFLRDLWWAVTSDEKHPPSVQKVISQQGCLPPKDSLTIKEYALLRPFYEAQREHSEPKTWGQLRNEGFQPIEKDVMDLESVCDLWNDAYADMPLNYEQVTAVEEDDCLCEETQ